MTKQELDKLTFEQKRKCIAILCGWHGCKYENGCYIGLSGLADHYEEVPDYYNDANEVHALEEWFVPVDNVLQRREYIGHLARIVDVDPDMKRWSFIQDFILCHATAAQRADAFLLTVG